MDIRALLEDLRRQNIVLKRYICVLGGGVALLLLMQSTAISTIMNYGLIVIVVMAVLLTAPLWSQFVVGVTDRIPWYPKRKDDRHDSATGPI